MVSNINVKVAEEHLNAIRIHDVESGGKMFGIVGAKGCGKTHLLVRLAHQVTFIHPETEKPEKETVIWRGRPIDYWNFMFAPDFEWESRAFKREVVVHYWEEDAPVFEDEFRRPIEVPVLIPYGGVNTLYDNLVPGAINVVYEPTRYTMSQGMQDEITRRSAVSPRSLDTIELDHCLWWSEFLFFLLLFKRAGFVTVILDEIDEIYPAASSGIRWHMQALFADSAKDFRKANISLFFSIHDLADLDYRIRSKIQYWGYMKGSRAQQGSLVPATVPLMLPVGEIIIDRGTYGNTNLKPLKRRPRVRVSYPLSTGDPETWDYRNLEAAIAEIDTARVGIDGMLCPACGYRWKPRTDYPRACPRCKQALAYPGDIEYREEGN